MEGAACLKVPLFSLLHLAAPVLVLHGVSAATSQPVVVIRSIRGGNVPDRPSDDIYRFGPATSRYRFDGLRISTTLVIKGTVVNSNATYRSGSTVTLAEVDFGEILDKPELLAKMATVQPGDQAAALEFIKKITGMKVDLNDELNISFR